MAQRGHQYDAQRLGSGVAMELKSHLPIERQTRVIGATWLDQQLISGGKGLGDLGFGSEVKDALRERELKKVGQDIAAETGLQHQPVVDGQRVGGIYRRSVMLASGRYAMLDDGMGFSLVPWKPVIEQGLGQTMTVTLGRGSVSWEFGRQHGPSVS